MNNTEISQDRNVTNDVNSVQSMEVTCREVEEHDQIGSQKAASDMLDSKVKKLFELKRKDSVKSRRNISEITAGTITESAVQSKMINFAEQSTAVKYGKKKLSTRKSGVKSYNKCVKSKPQKFLKKSEKSRSNKPCSSSKPGPSNIYVSDSSQSVDEDEMSESEKCCVCKLYEPKELHLCDSLIFVKWAECTLCSHCVHLMFCSEKRLLERGSHFNACTAPLTQKYRTVVQNIHVNSV